MDPERWKRIAEVYHAAAARAPGQRDAFLDVACSGDDALRREVQQLLAVSTVGGFETRAFTAKAHTAGDPAAPVLTGRCMGAFQIHERIGIGGMGEVYRACEHQVRPQW
jgi:serine/threonine-protein kinase